jgi:hypothetical protein
MDPTPGPWTVIEPHKHGDFYGAGAAYKITRADSDPRDWSVAQLYANIPESKANARLIAAAPDMYEALKKARVAIATWSPAPDEPLQEIDAAIAKAEGR